MKVKLYMMILYSVDVDNGWGVVTFVGGVFPRSGFVGVKVKVVAKSFS